MLHILLKLADFVETQEDSDEEFEDCMDAIDNDEVIDLDNFKEECYNCLTKQFDVILQRTRTLPHLMNLSRAAENALDEMQENSFAIISSMLYSNFKPDQKPSLKVIAQSKSVLILQTVVSYIENATYKCERPSGENASECLSLISGLD